MLFGARSYIRDVLITIRLCAQSASEITILISHKPLNLICFVQSRIDGVFGAVPSAAVMGVRRIFSLIKGYKKLTTFLVVTLKTQVFTVTTNAQNTLQHFRGGGQVPSKHYIFFEGGICVRRRGEGLCHGTMVSPSLVLWTWRMITPLSVFSHFTITKYIPCPKFKKLHITYRDFS